MASPLLSSQAAAELRARLNTLQTSVLDRKRRIDSDLNRESGPIPADFSEQATAVENDEALVAIQAEFELQLMQIEQALQRLETGEYGICESCQRPIDEARLQAMPAASVCIKCASRRE